MPNNDVLACDSDWGMMSRLITIYTSQEIDADVIMRDMSRGAICMHNLTSFFPASLLLSFKCPLRVMMVEEFLKGYYTLNSDSHILKYGVKTLCRSTQSLGAIIQNVRVSLSSMDNNPLG